MPEPVVHRTAWVRVASEIVRTALECEGTVPVAEAVKWLDVLEAAALASVRETGPDE